MTSSEQTEDPRAHGIFASHDRVIGTAAAAIIILCAWSAFFLLVWNVRRGFDVTDESYILYLYRYPHTILSGQWHQLGVISALLPSRLDHVITYRIIKLAGFVVLSGLFAAALSVWISQRFSLLSHYRLELLALCHFVAIGSLLAYCHGSQTLSYNDLVTFGLLGSGAALLAIDLCPSCVNRLVWNFVFSLLIGVILVLVFFAKWPSGILLTGYVVIVLTLLSAGHGRLTVLISLAGVIVGAMVLSFVLSDAGIGSAYSFSKLFTALTSETTILGHDGPSTILKRYMESTSNSLTALLGYPAVVAVLTLPIATLVVRAATRGSRTGRGLVVALTAASLLSLLAFASEMPGWIARDAEWFNRFRIADLQFFLVILAFFGTCCSLPFVANIVSTRTFIAFLFSVSFIVMLAPVGAIGTDNTLLTQFIRHMGPPFAALAVLAAFLGFAGQWRPFAPVICSVVAMFSTAQLIVTLLYHPYRLPRSGIKQTVEINAPPHMSGLKLDVEAAEFVHALLEKSKQAVGNTAGMPMLALFDIPGVIYILDAIAVGHPWHLAGSTKESATCESVRTDSKAQTRLQLIALDRDNIAASVQNCLRQGGVDLSTYVEAARIDLPYRNSDLRVLRLLVPREAVR